MSSAPRRRGAPVPALAPTLSLLAALAIPACLGAETDGPELHLPTEAEAQAEADARIDARNADAEYEALIEEIESDL